MLTEVAKNINVIGVGKSTGGGMKIFVQIFRKSLEINTGAGHCARNPKALWHQAIGWL